MYSEDTFIQIQSYLCRIELWLSLTQSLEIFNEDSDNSSASNVHCHRLFVSKCKMSDVKHDILIRAVI